MVGKANPPSHELAGNLATASFPAHLFKSGFRRRNCSVFVTRLRPAIWMSVGCQSSPARTFASGFYAKEEHVSGNVERPAIVAPTAV